MSNDVEYAKDFNAFCEKNAIDIYANRAIRIYNHYLVCIQRGANLNSVKERYKRDLLGDNYHPTKPQRSGLSSED